ncbi:MAG: hypothetical protein IJT43_02700 [Stomatobaculum sp.]|nr:hypothetical protein [Stomatobaculum sp.]
MNKELFFIKNRNKFLCGLLVVILLFALFPARADAASKQPFIALSYIPSYGEIRNVDGVVFKQNNGGFRPSDYRITLYLQVYDGGTYWVKPSYATPYVNINEDGTFSIPYVTGGLDEQAVFLHILLIPSDYIPNAGFNAAREAALDYVLISRNKEGAVSVTPENRVFQPYAEASSVRSDLPVPPEKLAVNVGFYTDGSAPGSALSTELISRQLEAASAFADTVRFYGSSGELYKAYNTAHSMGLSVIGTAWLSGNEEADRAELDALIEHCNNGLVSIACVGSETQLRGDLTSVELIRDMEYVRERLSDKSIPVTTADTDSILISNPELRKACDLLMPNCYPYWNGIEISEAAA